MEEAFIKAVISYMGVAQKSELLFGNSTAKKEFVLSKIKLYLGQETYERYAPMVSAMIDLLKAISRDKKILDGLKVSRLHCFKC